jgi:hypothetical protein
MSRWTAYRKGAIDALEEAADERGELWAGPDSCCYECAEKFATWLHGRAAVIYDELDKASS